ncbi:hypothetical protein Tcan_04119 [Toxocara canis]|uniref:Uncharacterized protein n=1 Tax=Toxocara canis TaxID=6265 RepID=A0A0B2VHT0_TOXCA|nr:hypothetical protein Tcan_04119 [Toxocara canis]
MDSSANLDVSTTERWFTKRIQRGHSRFMEDFDWYSIYKENAKNAPICNFIHSGAVLNIDAMCFVHVDGYNRSPTFVLLFQEVVRVKGRWHNIKSSFLNRHYSVELCQAQIGQRWSPAS